MAGKRTKNKAEETTTTTATMTQEINIENIINEIIQQEDTIWTKEDLQDLPKDKLDKILAAEKSRTKARAEVKAATKGRKDTRPQFTKQAKAMQRILDIDENNQIKFIEAIIASPTISAKELAEAGFAGWNPGTAKKVIAALYQNNMLSSKYHETLEDIMAETE